MSRPSRIVPARSQTMLHDAATRRRDRDLWRRIRRRPIEYQEREIQYVNKCPSIIAAPALYSIHC